MVLWLLTGWKDESLYHVFSPKFNLRVNNPIFQCQQDVDQSSQSSKKAKLMGAQKFGHTLTEIENVLKISHSTIHNSVITRIKSDLAENK